VQLLCIHGYVKSDGVVKQMPLALVLLPGHKKAKYVFMLIMLVAFHLRQLKTAYRLVTSK